MKRTRNPNSLKDRLTKQARALRSAATPAENLLWHALRNRRHGAKFRRQQPIDRFIVDFFCAERRLIIEVDGAVHEASREADALRQSHLEGIGMRVLRFTNANILTDLESVLRQVEAARQKEDGPA
ncbi:MAG: endonuclease domain-containing protein [Candidatus Lambdaproteobacteria bacterium]|nr:endonuclease domain-containing protein [Candidatus Lambdaproteobacteria bacterium]